jgi:hypothetical protein
MLAFVAVLLALVQLWTSEEACKNRAYSFRASGDFAGDAATLRLRATASTMSASEKQLFEQWVKSSESSSWANWTLTFQQ